MIEAQPTGTYIYNPATGSPVAEVFKHRASDARKVAEEARTAQVSWAARSLIERARIVRTIGRLIGDKADEFASTISECTGKTKSDALATEVLPATIAARYYAKHAPKALAPRREKRSSLLFVNKVTTLQRMPHGVVALISPWNYPLGIPAHELFQALLAGNAVLVKVATQTQPVGWALADILVEAGVPAGLVSFLHFSGAEAGTALLDAGIDKLFFSGATESGRWLAAEAGRRLIPVNLELGGNDAMIVLQDADLDRAVDGALWAGLSNAGQSCAAVERILCVDAVYDEFVARLRTRLKELRIGYGGVPGDIDIGSLTTHDQLQSVSALVEHARGDGARVVQSGRFFTAEGVGGSSSTERRAGSQRPVADAAQSAADLVGKPRGGIFYPPTLIEDAGDDARVMQEEVFGPVLTVKRMPGETEAVQAACRSSYGLTASVWTRDRRRAERVAAQLPVGTVTINDHLMSHGMPEAAWGGVKASGYGRSHGQEGFYAMTVAKTIVRQRWEFLFRTNVHWFPYTAKLYHLLSTLAAGRRGRLRAILTAFALAYRRRRSSS